MTSRRLAISIIASAAVLGGSVWTSRAATRRETAAEAAYPPTGRILTVNGLRVHADIQGPTQGTHPGPAPDVILIHGASGNTRDFTFDLVARLAPTYRVTCFDRPGMGWSDPLPGGDVSPQGQATHLQAAARQLGLQNPILLGHSYGGAVALAWALAAPGQIAALVLAAAASQPWPGGLGALYTVNASRLGGALVVPLITAFAPPKLVDATIAEIFAPQFPPAGYAAYIGAELTIRRQTIRINARQVNGLKPFLAQMAPDYPGLPMPVEIIHGSADTIVPPAIHSVPLSHQIPGANLVTLPGIGHMLHHAAPQAVVDAINRARLRIPRQSP